MIEYINSELFNEDSIDKQFVIAIDGSTDTITNNELHQENIQLTSALCSGDTLRFGSGEASTFTFRASNIYQSLVGKTLRVSLMLNGDLTNSFQVGVFKVHEDRPTADRTKRDITAYDALYDIINSNVADWYNTVLPNSNSTITLRSFRASFAAHFGLEEEYAELVNDEIVITKMLSVQELSGQDVLRCICEINGCFGIINNLGQLRYLNLKQSIEGLYPSTDLYPSELLYPREAKGISISQNTYIPPCEYSNFKVKSISGVQIRKEESDVGAMVGSNENLYTIQGNFLLYGKSASELSTIASRILSKIEKLTYRPFNVTAKGNLCLELGDVVRLNTKYQKIESYILRRTLKGIQALRDTYEASGAETIPQNVNNTRTMLEELKGKTNTLIRTVEENTLEIRDVESELSTRISQTAAEVSIKVSRGEVVSEINASADTIYLGTGRLVINSNNFKLDALGNVEVSGTINATSGKIGALNITAEGLQSSAGETIIWYNSIITNNVECYYLDVNSIGPRSSAGTVSMGDSYSTFTSLANWIFYNDIRVNGYDVAATLASLVSRVAALESA